MNKVQILLSTYNGEAHLPELLESLERQDCGDFSVLARDDGSTDGTVSLLEAAAARGALAFWAGDNIGVAPSYFELLARADDGFAYYAFCDQDDVWLPDKLSRALETLAPLSVEAPAMYCGRQVLVDENLERLGASRLPRRDPCLANALVENVATGCTVVFNAATREVLASERPGCAILHDWWAYLVTAALGRVVYDPRPRVLYRQHGANVVGIERDRWKMWKLRLERFRRHRERPVLWEQAAEFGRLYGSRLDPESRRILDRFLDRRRSRWAGVAYALRPDVFRQARLDDWIVRALIGLGRI